MSARPLMNISILGAGNLGLAQAAHLASLGHSIRLYNRSASRLAALGSGGKLRMRGVLDGAVELGLVTSDLKEAVHDAELIFVDVPASAHGELAEQLKQVLPSSSSAVVVLHPGQTFGALEFARRLGLPRFPRLALAELQTALYTARGEAPGEITVLALKRAVAVAAYPAASRDRLAGLRALYPQLLLEPDTLTTAISNVQSFIHPAVCLANLSRIERGETFRVYREGLSAGVGAIFEACDAERLALAKALGVDVPAVAAWFGRCYGVRAATAFEAMQRIEAYADLVGPTALDTRLLHEDVPTGLVPLVDLCRQHAVPAPSLEGLLTLCRVLTGGPGRGDRTLERLGLAGLDVARLRGAF